MSIQVCVTGLVAYLSQKLGVTFYLLGILLCLMVIDYLSGMAASAVEALDHPDDKSYGWSSKKGAKGIAKKVAYLFVIAVGMVIDYVIIQTSGVLGFNLPNTMLSLLVTVWYMLNEALSITEMSKLPPLYPVRKGGVSNMEPVLSFIVAVAAGVACHYIIKWLDGDK